MTTRTKVLLVILAVVSSFAVGRYSVDQKPSVTIKTDVKSDTQVSTGKDTHKETVITKEKAKDGTVKEVTIITEDSTTKTDKTKSTDSKTSVVSVVSKRSAINVSLLAAVDISNPNKLSYGLSVDKELVGPLTVGAFGLSNGVVGIRIGLNF